MIKYNEIKHLPIWTFNCLDKSEIKHFVSGRAGGVSSGDLGELNLSFKVGDNPEQVKENRRRLAESMGVKYENLIFPSQTHSCNVRTVTKDNFFDEFAETDALITNESGKMICVMSADCVPVLLYDPSKKVVAALHAGWKGTVGRIVEKTIVEMGSMYGTRPQDLIAAIGPSICKEVYEVGGEVISEVRKSFGAENDFVKQIENSQKGFIDLWEMNRFQLTSAGVLQENIEIAGICTYKNSDQFFSARRSGNKAGRFAAGIMIK